MPHLRLIKGAEMSAGGASIHMRQLLIALHFCRGQPLLAVLALDPL